MKPKKKSNKFVRSKRFRKMYFAQCSENYNIDNDLEYLSFRNEPNADMAYLEAIIGEYGCISNQETYKAHYSEIKDRYFMDLGQCAACLYQTDAYTYLPLRKGFRK
jgi:hypothetical protein